MQGSSDTFALINSLIQEILRGVVESRVVSISTIVTVCMVGVLPCGVRLTPIAATALHFQSSIRAVSCVCTIRLSSLAQADPTYKRPWFRVLFLGGVNERRSSGRSDRSCNGWSHHHKSRDLLLVVYGLDGSDPCGLSRLRDGRIPK